ncbi:MAG: hypothetical protein Q8942_17670 [Bacillota bacterium]|nr:hypothetical protein [Bacillota bacterium]
MKKIIALCTTFVLVSALTAVLSTTSFASDTQQTIDTNLAQDLALDSTATSTAAVEDNISKIDLKSFKSKFSTSITELNQLRATCKDLWTQIKSSNVDIKTQWKNLKTSLSDKDKAEKKNILADVKAKLDPDRTNLKTLHSDIKAIRAQKTAEWVNFRAAVKSRDEVKASAALNNIISLKKQIIEKQRSILSLKQEIFNIIKSDIT